MRIAPLGSMFFDAGVLIEILFQHVDASTTGRVSAAIVLLLAVVGSWGTFSGGE